MLATVAFSASQLDAARSQMAFTPNYLGPRRDDADALLLARCCSSEDRGARGRSRSALALALAQRSFIEKGVGPRAESSRTRTHA